MGRSDHLYCDPVHEKRKEKRAGGNAERSEGAAETAAAGKTFTAAACGIAVDSAKGKGKRLEAVR